MASLRAFQSLPSHNLSKLTLATHSPATSQRAFCRNSRSRKVHTVAASLTPGSVVREVLRKDLRYMGGRSKANENGSKLDDTDDRQFYQQPRLVRHVDDNFIAQLTQLYRERIPPGSRVLDLCSSWVSHLPTDIKYSRVVGHGMNAAELARNPQLDEFFIRDLNKNPDEWAAADWSFDAVVCCVSVQYMQQPEKVFAEIYRVLAPGGVVIISFSNRMFFQKAIAAWRDADSGYARTQLVKSYFMAIEGFTMPEALTQVKLPSKPKPLSSMLPGPLATIARLFERSSSDPFYAVIAYKGQRPQYSQNEKA